MLSVNNRHLREQLLVTHVFIWESNLFPYVYLPVSYTHTHTRTQMWKLKHTEKAENLNAQQPTIAHHFLRPPLTESEVQNSWLVAVLLHARRTPFLPTSPKPYLPVQALGTFPTTFRLAQVTSPPISKWLCYMLYVIFYLVCPSTA